MTQPPQPPPPNGPPDLAQMRNSVADALTQLAAHRGQLRKLTQRLDDAGIAEGSDLMARFEALARTVADALDAASPAGPPAPRWNDMDDEERRTALAWLTSWVRRVLIPGWVTLGPYQLADCWASHEAALWELGTICAQWHRIYARPKPHLGLALEFNDRWLPGAMRLVGEATAGCERTGHPAGK